MPLNGWRSHWQSIDTSGSGSIDEALRQVGKTLLGKPVAPKQVEILINHIATQLALVPTDRVLDCGCGNGLLTSCLAGRVAEVLGIDYSQPLLNIARTLYARDNIRYALDDLANMNGTTIEAQHFNKAWSCEVLQHLLPADARRLFDSLGRVLIPGYKILACGIPDRTHLRDFYNTPERWELYCRNMQQGGDQIGYWWGRAELSQLAAEAGMGITFIEQPPALYTSHYRFDILLEAQ